MPAEDLSSSAVPTNKLSKTERKQPQAAESVMQASRMALTQGPISRNMPVPTNEHVCA